MLKKNFIYILLKTRKIKSFFVLFITGIAIIPVNSCRKDIISDPNSDSHVYTTIDRTIIPVEVASWPVLYPYEVARYAAFPGYGEWNYGPGLACQKRLDIMPSGYNSALVIKASGLLNFFAVSDAHMTDEETPASAINFGYKGGFIGAYSPVMLYSTQVLDAAIRTINALNRDYHFDFGISLGDVCNNMQYNELRWYLDVFDGKQLSPDSGTKDDPVAGPANDYQDTFQPEGLDHSIPWYQTLGNHDHFWTGLLSPGEEARNIYTGDVILNLGNIFEYPNAPHPFNSLGTYMGSVDGSTPLGEIIGMGTEAGFLTPPKVSSADPDRRSLIKGDWMEEFFNTTTDPKGHGFTSENVSTGFACYTFDPKADIPVRVIVLDDTQSNDDPNINFYAHSSLDIERYNWLVNELEKGQLDKKLMIISSHIPIGVLPPDNGMSWSSGAAVSEADFLAKLHTYPNLILWLAGHRHVNQVTPMASPDPAHPENGFWEVETTSLRDFPQQFRLFEINRNSDNTVSIVTTNIDPVMSDGSLPALSRFYAVAAQQIYNILKPYAPSFSYNAELVKLLSNEMQDEIRKY